MRKKSKVKTEANLMNNDIYSYGIKVTCHC